MTVAELLNVGEAVRALSLGTASAEQLDTLARLRLAVHDDLTRDGRALEHAWCVLEDEEAARSLWQVSLLHLPEVQALIQGLHGIPAVPLTGAAHFLARHGFVSAGEETAVRVFLMNLSRAGIVAYSNKHQTVRILANVADVEERFAPIVRFIERERPFSNLRHLREVLRSCRAYLWWADPHFSRRGLEPLSEEADAAVISEIRLLSGDANIGSKTGADFERFREEMANVGIRAEWRIVPKADRVWHDRYVVTKGHAWNVPPVDLIYRGDYSDLSDTNRPPFAEWWELGVPLDAYKRPTQ